MTAAFFILFVIIIRCIRRASCEELDEFFIRHRLNVNVTRSDELRIEASFTSATAGDTGADPFHVVTDRFGESDDRVAINLSAHRVKQRGVRVREQITTSQ